MQSVLLRAITMRLYRKKSIVILLAIIFINQPVFADCSDDCNVTYTDCGTKCGDYFPCHKSCGDAYAACNKRCESEANLDCKVKFKTSFKKRNICMSNTLEQYKKRNVIVKKSPSK